MWYLPFPSVYRRSDHLCLLHGTQNAMAGAPYVKIKITGIIKLKLLEGREEAEELGAVAAHYT